MWIRRQIPLVVASIFIPTQLHAQSCGVTTASPVACLTLEWVRTLAALQRTEDEVKDAGSRISDGVELGFYAIKKRLIAQSFAVRQLQPYRNSPDRKVASAAAFPVKVIQRFNTLDSAQQVALRRIAAFKSSVGEMQELSAERKVQNDQALSLLMAATGEVLDASVIVDPKVDKVSKRRMTIRERDMIVAAIDSTFLAHDKVESDGLWYSTYAAVAATLRANLMGQWVYLK